MPGQWEFQIGPVGAPDIGDQIWVARWLLYRIAEDYKMIFNQDSVLIQEQTVSPLFI